MYVFTTLVAGAFGAVARYVTDGAVHERWAPRVPMGTLVVNVLGSFVLGLLTGAALYHHPDPALRTVVGTGFCGALTTWSTLSWETVRLLDEGAPGGAALAMLCGLGSSLAAGALGIALVALT